MSRDKNWSLTNKEDAPPSHVLVEWESRIERNETQQDRVTQVAGYVTTRGQQDHNERVHHGRSSSASDGHTPSGGLSESDVLPLHGVH